VKHVIPLNKLYLFSYFMAIIGVGSVFLALPVSWPKDGGIKYIDALFTAVSASCVTGLITVNTANFSLFGQIVILVLIQSGGLGIISFTSIYLINWGRKISLTSRMIIKDYYVDTIEYDPKRIIRNILIFTFVMETLGVVFLYVGFHKEGISEPFYSALFHSVSAFCNAGFSLFPNSFEDYNGSHIILLTLMILIAVGGIGFVVIQDVIHKINRKRYRLSLHSKVVLFTSFGLIIFGTVIFLLLERANTLAGMPLGTKISSAFFQSVTPRTAGFNSLAQGNLTFPSQFLTVIFMFIGGAPGSIAGGVKVTTFFIVLIIAIKGIDPGGEVNIMTRKINRHSLSKASNFLIKAVFLLLIYLFLFIVSESFIAGKNFSFMEMIFEVCSAFGTVGLSQGITPFISSFGKIIIIITMFTGRVVIISIVMPKPETYKEKFIDYPAENLLIG
jgi:trk system potassium uptake protein